MLPGDVLLTLIAGNVVTSSTDWTDLPLSLSSYLLYSLEKLPSCVIEIWLHLALFQRGINSWWQDHYHINGRWLEWVP